MLPLFTVICGALLFFLALSKRQPKLKGKALQYFKYPRWKNLNYAHAKESGYLGYDFFILIFWKFLFFSLPFESYSKTQSKALQQKIPKIFHAEVGYPVGRIVKAVVIADFDLMKEAFAKKELCSRFGKQNVRRLETASRAVSSLQPTA